MSFILYTWFLNDVNLQNGEAFNCLEGTYKYIVHQIKNVGSSLGQVLGHYDIGISCFSAKHAALRDNSKNWLARIQDVSDWSDMSTRGLWFQLANTIKLN